MFRTNDVIALTFKSLACLAIAALCYFAMTFTGRGTDDGHDLVLFKINADVLEHVELMEALAQVNDLLPSRRCATLR